LLTITLKRNVFQNGKSFYKPRMGITMDSAVLEAVAAIILYNLETQTLKYTMGEKTKQIYTIHILLMRFC
jgi:hypothetical protein